MELSFILKAKALYTYEYKKVDKTATAQQKKWMRVGEENSFTYFRSVFKLYWVANFTSSRQIKS